MPAIGGVTRLLASNKNEMAGERWSMEELAALQNRSSLQGLDLAPSRRWFSLNDTQKELRKYLDTKEFEQGFYADRTPARGEAGWSRVTQLTGEFQGSHLWGVIAKHSSADNADKPHGWRQNEFAQKPPGTLPPDAVHRISSQMQASFDDKPHVRQRKGWSWTEIGNTRYQPAVGPGMPGSVHLSQLAPQQLQYARSQEAEDAGSLLEPCVEESFDLPALNPKLMRLLSTSSPSLLARLPRQSPATGQLRISDMSRLPSLSFQLRGGKPARLVAAQGKFTWLKAIRRLAELKFWRSNAKVQVANREIQEHARRASVSSVVCDFDTSPPHEGVPDILALDARDACIGEAKKPRSTFKKMKNALSLLFARLSKHATNKVTHQSSQIKEASPKSKPNKPQWLATSNGRSKRNVHHSSGGDSAFEGLRAKNKPKGHIRTVAKHIVASNRLSHQVSGKPRLVGRAFEVQKEDSLQGHHETTGAVGRGCVDNPAQQSPSPNMNDVRDHVYMFTDDVLQASPGAPARAEHKPDYSQSPAKAMNVENRLIDALPSPTQTGGSKIRASRPTHTRGRTRMGATALPDDL